MLSISTSLKVYPLAKAKTVTKCHNVFNPIKDKNGLTSYMAKFNSLDTVI